MELEILENRIRHELAKCCQLSADLIKSFSVPTTSIFIQVTINIPALKLLRPSITLVLNRDCSESRMRPQSTFCVALSSLLTTPLIF